jgi:DNA-binding transcriptional ArsR family regulator
MAEQFDDDVFEHHAEFCKAFANSKRLKILTLLKEGEHTVSEISERTDIPQPTVSQHLRKMRDQGIVEKRDAGSQRYYAITDDRIIEGMSIMREVLLDRIDPERSLTNDR